MKNWNYNPSQKCEGLKKYSYTYYKIIIIMIFFWISSVVTRVEKRLTCLSGYVYVSSLWYFLWYHFCSLQFRYVFRLNCLPNITDHWHYFCWWSWSYGRLASSVENVNAVIFFPLCKRNLNVLPHHYPNILR